MVRTLTLRPRGANRPGEAPTMTAPDRDDERTTPQEGGTSLTLLQRLRANEPDAWRTMVHLYTPLVYRWCAQFGVRGADADDVLQEVFRTAATRLENFRRERPGDSFRAWLRGITRYMSLLHFRRSGRQPQAIGGTDALVLMQETLDHTPETDAHTDGPAELEGLRRRALEQVRGEFEERTWEMFWRTVIDGRSPVDLAAEMGVTPAAVRKAKSRVLHRFKETFGDLLQ
jgi:RNA polymerase sigma-70 factor (ECF subfamily)